MSSRRFVRTWMFGALAVASVITVMPRPASAVPCCSAPGCQKDPPLPICAICTPGCFADDDGTGPVDAVQVDYAHDFDAAAGVCYAVK